MAATTLPSQNTTGSNAVNTVPTPGSLTTPVAPTPTAPTTPNTALFAQPGENFAQYEARVAGGNSGNAGTTPTTPNADTSAEDEVAQSLGYKDYADATNQLTATPTESETDLYNKAYSAAGLDQLQSTITGRQNDLATAQNNINDNPWLDEASRVGRNKTVTDLANADIKNYQDEYTNKLKGVEDLVTREAADNTATSASNKAKLAALEAQAKALAATNAATAKAASAAPKTVKGASGATYQWDATSGTFKQILPGKASATSTATTKAQQATAVSKLTSAIQNVITQGKANGQKDDYISPDSWSQALAEWTAAGYSTADFVKQFKGYANTADKTNHYEGLN